MTIPPRRAATIAPSADDSSSVNETTVFPCRLAHGICSSAFHSTLGVSSSPSAIPREVRRMRNSKYLLAVPLLAFVSGCNGKEQAECHQTAFGGVECTSTKDTVWNFLSRNGLWVPAIMAAVFLLAYVADRLSPGAKSQHGGPTGRVESLAARQVTLGNRVKSKSGEFIAVTEIRLVAGSPGVRSLTFANGHSVEIADGQVLLVLRS